ncbi:MULTISPECIES: hemolysin family protein [Bacillus]|uniref:HlyC/CorC family transporter n=1 Tax=Bacillus glycinifermentans TaxID=1664069 RepID=A0AAJ3YXH4_9BACI|nr:MULTISPECIES: hemolysin family protein [Bacillus]KKB74846.1 membrane protein [Bacillus sp. TH008]MDU0071519.1 hemolysin family protein [Bacillus sp. IG6]MED8019388.1 hemolysin family protein [Bacillus glycinifermentans]QAT64434.1 HlyC/CorC family transporter [Bacillus glycinifermentans]WKB78371.1 hemolysin family protein [Bacillus glycinifermentans]
MDIVNLIFVAVLIALTAFFVASEFAIIRIRTSRIDQLIAEGNKTAISVKKVVTHLDEYLSACQLGITLTALGLGWLGEPTVARLLEPLFVKWNIPSSASHIVAVVIAFSFITFLHVVVGELAPKTLAIQKAETISFLFAKPLILFYRVMFPFIWALNGSARLLTKAFGLEAVSENEMAHSEEELRIILSESYKSGEINQSEFKYVNKIFEFDDRLAKEIMIPRTEVVSFPHDMKIKDMIDVTKAEGYTRYPVEDGDKDNIIGVVNVKEILTACISGECSKEDTIERFINPIIHVIETVPIHDLLLKMQKERVHMAILADEYGGTAGLVTVEDIIEEIVGEIRDEFDIDEINEIRKLDEDHYILDGKVLINQVNDLLGIQLDNEEVDTIGGWFLTQKYEVQKGDMIIDQGFEFIINEVDGHHVSYVEVKRAAEQLLEEA